MAEPAREPQISVTVDHSPPVRTPEGQLKFIYWAIVGVGRRGVEGQPVEFLVNNNPYSEAESRHDGRTLSREYTSPEPGIIEVTLEAQIKGNAAVRSKKIPRVEVRTTQAASIKHFKVKDPDKDGNVLVALRVLDKDGMPVQGAIVNLLDKAHPKMVYDLEKPTNRAGLMNFSVSAEPIRDVVVLIHGIEERIRTTYS